jgi:hypothetical protein
MIENRIAYGLHFLTLTKSLTGAVMFAGQQSRFVWKQHSTIERSAHTSAAAEFFSWSPGASASPVYLPPGKQFYVSTVQN